MKTFHYNTKLYQFLIKAMELVTINILWILCSIPIITIGASTTAKYDVLFRIFKGEDAHIARKFFKAFAANFKQATVITGILLVLAVVIFLDVRLLSRMDSSFEILGYVVAFAIGLITLSTCSYIFPWISRIDDKLANSIKNCFLISMKHLPRTCVIVLLNALPAIILLISYSLFLYMLVFWVTLGFVLIAYCNAKLIDPIICRYFPQGT